MRLQEAPKRPQGAPKRPPRGTKKIPRTPKHPQEASKLPPRAPREAHHEIPTQRSPPLIIRSLCRRLLRRRRC
eukprot:5666869-Pyramimonas_sp.AAC.1